MISHSKFPYIIAEIGFNHLGSYRIAKKMITAAHKAGVDAVKFQTYVPEEMVFKSSTHFKSIKNTTLTENEYKNLRKIAKSLQLDFLSTPFDKLSYDLLKRVNVDSLKIASMDLNNFQLLNYIKNFKKTIFLSTGMANITEIKKSYNFLKKYNKNIFLLHCISKYPTDEKDANIDFLNKLKKISGKNIGFSDHTLTNVSSMIAVNHGARIIEKHFTFNKKLKGADNKNSLDTDEMIKFVKDLKIIRDVKRDFYKNKRPDEYQKKSFRRYFFARKNLSKGKIINDDDLICLRSNKKNLISASKYFRLIGTKLKKDLKKFDPIN